MKSLTFWSVLLVGIFFSEIVKSQNFNQGIGLRVGDPLGITYKNYLQGRHALELIFGSASNNGHDNYYRDMFKRINKFDDFRYVNHDVNYTVAFQGRFLFHETFPANVEGRLDWYYGVGAHLRVSSLDYSYFDQNNVLFVESNTNFDLGPEGVIGVEYELLDYPLVVFTEVSLLGELVDNPFRFRFFGAVGVRYAFNQ